MQTAVPCVGNAPAGAPGPDREKKPRGSVNGISSTVRLREADGASVKAQGPSAEVHDEQGGADP